MSLKPLNINHALQIQAGIQGRKKGHEFEHQLAKDINSLNLESLTPITENLLRGNPAKILVSFALQYAGWSTLHSVEAIALGTLATAEEGKKWLEVQGVTVTACKSDVLLILKHDDLGEETIGVSVKQCNTKSPTNAQLFFSTAHAFCELLRRNSIVVSERGEAALRQFCGDSGYRPLDNPQVMKNRQIDPRRYFWEEIDTEGKFELERILTDYQDEITLMLLQKAYLNDPFAPELLIHKTRKLDTDPQEFAVYSIDELVELSRKHSGFTKKEYRVKKGQYKDPDGIFHEAPRFGIVQMQRGGQKQHPSQLQFNLKAGYFYHI